jgi:hypothetical protein
MYNDSRGVHPPARLSIIFYFARRTLQVETRDNVV